MTLLEETGLTASALKRALAHPKCPPPEKFKSRASYIKRLCKLSQAAARSPARARKSLPERPVDMTPDEDGNIALNAMTVEEIKRQKDIALLLKARGATEEGKQRVLEEASDQFANEARFVFNRLSDVVRECALDKKQTEAYKLILDDIADRLEKLTNGEEV